MSRLGLLSSGQRHSRQPPKPGPRRHADHRPPSDHARGGSYAPCRLRRLRSHVEDRASRGDSGGGHLLASDESSFMAGSDLLIDAGMSNI